MKILVMKQSVITMAILWLAIACEKDPLVPAENRPPQPMIKTIITTDPLGYIKTDTFFYDSLWRLVKHNYMDGNTTGTNTYVYDSLNRWVMSGSTQWPLNSQGLIANDGVNATYSYNTNLNRVGVDADYGGATYTYNSDGNMTVSESYNTFHNGIYFFRNDYVYNNHTNTIGSYNKGIYYSGKPSVNLVEREDWSATTNNITRGFTLFNYTYNDSGWVSIMEQNRATLITDTAGIVYDTTHQLYRYNYTYY